MIFFRNWKKFTNKKKQIKTMQLYSTISYIMYGNKMKLENRTKSNIPQIILKVGMNNFYFTYIKFREDYIYSKVHNSFLGFTIICIITTRLWTIKFFLDKNRQ